MTLEEIIAIMQQGQPQMDPRSLMGPQQIDPRQATPFSGMDRAGQAGMMANIMQQRASQFPPPTQTGEVGDPMDFAQEVPGYLEPQRPGESFRDRLGVGLSGTFDNAQPVRGFAQNFIRGAARGFSKNQVLDMQQRAEKDKRVREAAAIMNANRAKQAEKSRAGRLEALRKGSEQDKNLAQREKESLRTYSSGLLREANKMEISMMQEEGKMSRWRRNVGDQFSKIDPKIKLGLGMVDDQATDERRRIMVKIRSVQGQIKDARKEGLPNLIPGLEQELRQANAEHAGTFETQRNAYAAAGIIEGQPAPEKQEKDNGGGEIFLDGAFEQAKADGVTVKNLGPWLDKVHSDGTTRRKWLGPRGVGLLLMRIAQNEKENPSNQIAFPVREVVKKSIDNPKFGPVRRGTPAANAAILRN